MADGGSGPRGDDETGPEELREQREHRRAAAAQRIHVVDALIRAIDLGWPLIEEVERSADRGEAQRRLTGPPFSFDETQAAHVLDVRLGERTGGRRGQLVDEKAELVRFLAEG